jgi:hypothetical protein
MLALFLGTAVAALSSQAIIFYSTGDPGYNTAAPTGTLADSGWQYEGLWGGFLGTAIAPRYFIAAKHVGGAVGDKFTLNGADYTTTAVFDDPNSDLKIWRVCGTLPVFAPLYTNNNESGRSLVVVGRGTQRAEPVVTATTNVLGQVSFKTNGWHWGNYDGVVRWGENVVAGAIDGNALFGAGLGSLLQARFNSGAGSNECHLSFGDSSGGVFIRDGSTWKLAGINYAVDGPYNTTDSGPGFSAAIFDEGGLYKQDGDAWVVTPDLPVDQSGSFYATRISSNLAWINSVLNAATVDDSIPLLQSASTIPGAFADVGTAVIDATNRTITLPQPPQAGFYRLRACSSFRITAIEAQGPNLVLHYQ